MFDQYNRHINYLRISVTDHCNLRCTYCMPEKGVSFLKKTELLSPNQIVEVVKVAAKAGISKIRFTGGEPLLRDELPEIIKQIKRIKGIEDISLTSNGILLKNKAETLAKEGLNRINISLDTMDEKKFGQITRLGHLQDVLEGIHAAKQAGLKPIKINCVIKKSFTEPDAQKVTEFAKAHGFEIRYIKEMNLENGYFTKVFGGEGGNCANCNRLRLTAKGVFMPCLFSNIGYDIHAYGIKKALDLAIQNKPELGTYGKGNFYKIGG